jgi:hypothetical protein
MAVSRQGADRVEPRHMYRVVIRAGASVGKRHYVLTFEFDGCEGRRGSRHDRLYALRRQCRNRRTRAARHPPS